ncbi:MAG: CDP-alcohol phosphatidyltransferase family protein [Chloroflexota bacterium]|nr:CDP-alcohol phosphatidyltransferase family protein [Chloroflexota bacterium]
MGIVNARSTADGLTIFRVLCAIVLAFRPSFPLLLVAVVSDWLDGPLARHAGPTSRGARLDLEADSLLTLGAAIAAVRSGAPRVVLLAPVARYALQVARPELDPDEARWDRVTGVAQMVVLAAAIARLPLTALALPVSAARTAALAARIAPR